MENLLLAQLREALPQGMHVPSELEALYAWIEANGFYDDAGGRRRGYLYPQDRLQQSWSDDEREGGTDIALDLPPQPGGVALLLGELRGLDLVDGRHGDGGGGQEDPRGGLERDHAGRGRSLGRHRRRERSRARGATPLRVGRRRGTEGVRRSGAGAWFLGVAA